MTSLFKMDLGRAISLVSVLEQAGFDEELAEKVRRNPALAQRMVAALRVPEDGHPYRGGANGSSEGDEFRVRVEYKMSRDMATLESEFSKDGVSEFFYSNYEWQLHSSCQDIDQTPGERDFLVKHFDRSIASDEAITEMDKLGYRPATHLEAYAFAKAHPELQCRFWIVALGSFAVCGGDRGVAVLRSGSGRRLLHCHWFGLRWVAGHSFLFVRKASS